MTCVLHCEIDPFCRKVLKKHWPGVPQHDDIRTLSAEILRPYAGCDLVAGGFPCQGISSAGKRLGLEDARSSLWWEMHRVLGLVRPRWLLIENVPDLKTNGYDAVAGALEADGYTLWPLVVGAYSVGATHKRDRVWIVGRILNDTEDRSARHSKTSKQTPWRVDRNATSQRASDFDRTGPSERALLGENAREERAAALRGHGWPARRGQPKRPGEPAGLLAEPPLVQFVHGVPRELARRDRALKRAKVGALGNAVVPQVVAEIGRAILAAEACVRTVT